MTEHLTLASSTDPSHPVVLSDDLCSSCGKCLDACPTGVFEREPGTQRVLARYAADCHACYLCVPDCPTGALTIRPDAPNPRLRSVYDDLAITLPELLPSTVEPRHDREHTP